MQNHENLSQLSRAINWVGGIDANLDNVRLLDMPESATVSSSLYFNLFDKLDSKASGLGNFCDK